MRKDNIEGRATRNDKPETINQKFLIFEPMHPVGLSSIQIENASIESDFLKRDVLVDFYLPFNLPSQEAIPDAPSQLSLLLINDGQNMKELGLGSILTQLYADHSIEPILCVAIHAGEERKLEYGIASQTDYKGRGAKAGLYTSFIMEELIPFIRKRYDLGSFREKAFAGFSLGGLMAMDIVWNHPHEFSKAGVFSGSFWWRSIDQGEKIYDDHRHRIMHQQIKEGAYYPWLQFFFQCGNMDETRDRNHNGIIDSIDDTCDLVNELVAKGYDREKAIYYMEMHDGHHNIATWGKAMPVFLKWGWGKVKS